MSNMDAAMTEPPLIIEVLLPPTGIRETVDELERRREVLTGVCEGLDEDCACDVYET